MRKKTSRETVDADIDIRVVVMAVFVVVALN